MALALTVGIKYSRPNPTQLINNMSNVHTECSLHTPASHAASEIILATAASRSSQSMMPSPPSKFSRRQTGQRSQCKNIAQQPEQDFIDAIRRNTRDQIYASDMCPVGAAHADEDLWAAVDHIFLQ
jgi:hypothetical protein